MNAIKPAVIVFIVALGLAGAATVAPAAARLQAAGADSRVVTNQEIDPGLPTVTIVAKRLGTSEKIRSAG